MKNKNKFTFITLMLSALLTMSACTKGPASESSETKPSEDSSVSETSISESEESIPEESTTESIDESESTPIESESVVEEGHTVQFVVEGEVVYTTTVEDGELATYEGSRPTKDQGTSELGYVFKCWDKDLFTPITEDTTFTAIFSEYASEVMIDNFEEYNDSGSMKDEGWTALGYNSGTQSWTTDTKASVTLGYKSVEGQRSLRFDAWENGVGYKFAQIFNEDRTFDNAANALRFKLMVPNINNVSLILHAAATIQGKKQAPSFTYRFKPESSEYVEYTIPLNDPAWALWGEAGKSIASVAEWSGIHQDTILNYLTRIEFYIEGNDGHSWPYIAFLDSISFVTLNNPKNSQVEDIGPYDRYTATLNDGHILRIDIDGEDAIAKVIDLETPIEIPGKISIVGRNISFMSNDGTSLIYNGTIIHNGKLIKYKSATGTYKSAVEDVDFKAVQVVEDFEQYEENGIAYSQANKRKNNVSGMRGAYYVEYYTNAGTPADFSGAGWELSPEGDFVNLRTDAENAHSGNQYGSFLHKNANAVRYMQWDLFNGMGDKYSFRGDKFGFWAKGFVNLLKVHVFSNSKPEHSTMSSRVMIGEFSEGPNVEEWTHFEITLNPELVYYGFLFTIEKDYASDKQLFLDDIEVYGADPYAHYIEPEPAPAREPVRGMSFLGKINGTIATQLTIEEDNKVSLTANGLGLAEEGTYDTDENGDVTFTFGTTEYVANISEDLERLTYKSIKGSDIVAQGLNNLSFEAFDILESAESYDEPGLMYYQGNTNEANAKGARAAYYCDYKPGSGSSPVGGSGWTLMGGSGDQLGLDKNQGYNSNQSLTFKRSSGYDLRFMQWKLYKGTAKEHTGVDEFVMYFKNTNSDAVTLDLYVFTTQKLTPSTVNTERVQKEFTIPANSDWVKCVVELDVDETYYGYGVYTHKGGSNIYINGDNAYFSGPNKGPEFNFYGKKDLALTGEAIMGNASLTFNEGNEFTFDYADAGLTAEVGTYAMKMTMDGQEITFTVADSTIKGIYVIDMMGHATFTITEVTGTLESLIDIGTVFAN